MAIEQQTVQETSMPGITENTSIVDKKSKHNKREKKAELKELNSDSNNSRVKKSELSK